MIPMFIKIVVEQYINHITPLPFSLRADPTVAWTANWNRPNWITAEFSLLYRWHSLMPDAIDWPGGHIPIGDFTLNNAPLLDVGLDAAFSAARSSPPRPSAPSTRPPLCCRSRPTRWCRRDRTVWIPTTTTVRRSAWPRRAASPTSAPIPTSSRC